MGTQNKHTTTRVSQSQSDVHVPENRYVQIVSKKDPSPPCPEWATPCSTRADSEREGTECIIYAPPLGGGVALRCGVRVPVGYSPVAFFISSSISFSLRIHKKWKGDNREVVRGGGVNSEGV